MQCLSEKSKLLAPARMAMSDKRMYSQQFFLFFYLVECQTMGYFQSSDTDTKEALLIRAKSPSQRKWRMEHHVR